MQLWSPVSIISPSFFLPLVLASVLCCTGSASASIPESPAEESSAAATISGDVLSIVRRQEEILVKQGDRVLVGYRYLGVPGKPYVAEMASPGGTNVLRDAPADHPHHHGLMFALNIDGADFWSENDDCGRQIHEQWIDLRIDSFGGRERAVLREQLIWETAEGDYILEEVRTLTIPAAVGNGPQMLVWQADFTPGEDAFEALTISGATYEGLGMRLIEPMDTAGMHFNAVGGTGVERTNGKRAAWSAYTAPTGPQSKATVAMFDAPSNPRHPTEWFTMGETPPFAYLSATLGVGSEPLKLEPGKTLSVRFGVAVFDGAADADVVGAAYRQWYRLQAASRTGLQRGLVARYAADASAEKPACVRVDPSVAFDFSGGAPDDRLAAGAFSAQWSGQVRVERDGTYRFGLRGREEGSVWIGEQKVCDPGSPLDREPIVLRRGYHPIRVEHAAAEGSAAERLQLVWESDHFAPEGVNPRYLVHDAAALSADAMRLMHDRGRVVVERYGCRRCHAISGVAAERRPAAPLGFASRADREYLDRWLRDPQAVRPQTTMPALGGTAEQIDAAVPAVVAYLASLTPPKEIAPGPELAGVSDAERDEQIQHGRRRFSELGCAACHAPEEPDGVDPTLAPTLADVGAKWPQDVLRQFLLDPLGWHPEGGMPDFALKPIDAERLAAYLATFGRSESASAEPATAAAHPAELVARGKEIVEQRNCAACHLITEADAQTPPISRLGVDTDASAGCLRSGRIASTSPQFTLPVADRVAVAEFLAVRPEQASCVGPQELAQRTIDHRFGCRQCHVRDGSGGEALSRAVLRYAAEEKTADQVALTPPDLSGVGARLRREWMLLALAGNAPSARPWLKVRMPGFALSDAEREAIADRLATADVIPDAKAPRPHRLPTALPATAGQLLSGRGFSCVNCHYVGKTPSSSETSAPDLTMMHRRVDRDWYHRWLADPARILPTTPMPAFNVPATKIAGEDLLVQTETVWQFLKHTPAASIKKMLAEGTTAVQVAGLRPMVVQGQVRGYPGLTRAVAIGFSNRNSLAFDFERVAWRAVWKGGFLNEAGRHGAQHWWEPVAAATWLSHDNGPPIVFREKATGNWIGPALWRERFGFVGRVTLIGRAVQIDYRLRAPGERTGTYEPEAWVHVSELIEPNPVGPGRDGTTRTIRIRGVPAAYDAIVQQSLGGIEGKTSLGDRLAEKTLPVADFPSVTIQTDAGRSWVTRVAGESARWIAPPESITYPVEQPPTDDLPMDATKRYDPIVQPGEGRMAVLLPNSGSDRPLELIWQTAEIAGDGPIAAGPPRRWPKPPENVVLQDPKKPSYVGYPVEVAELGQSRTLAVPPGFRVERLPLEEEFLVCGLNFYRGKLLVGGYDGELRIADDTDGDGLPDSYRYFGGTLQQITNLRVYDGEIYVTAPGAVYRIRDTNGDDVADSYELLSSLWDCSTHQNDWFFGLTRDKDGNLYGGNSTPYVYRPGGKPPGYHLRGDMLKITPDGRTMKVGTGLRFQFGFAEDRHGRMYFNINQGHYNYTCGIHEIVEGAHYGFLEPDVSKVRWPVVRTPYPWCKALNGMDFAESPVPFGPFQDQGFSADYNTNQVVRWTDYPVGEKRQGSCYPFFTGTDAGPTEIVFGPDGAMYVGFMCDQGWYGGPGRGGIYKITYTGPVTFAVAEARATADGFDVTLTDAADPASVTPEVCRQVHRWWHENKGDYASPEIAHEDVPVRQITLSDDGRTLHLKTDRHVTPRLVRVELRGLRTADGRELADGLVFLTVHWLPE